jgi:hypothetical protein
MKKPFSKDFFLKGSVFCCCPCATAMQIFYDNHSEICKVKALVISGKKTKMFTIKHTNSRPPEYPQCASY